MADRNMTAAMLTEIDKDTIYPVHLVEVYFDSETGYLCNADVDISWDGNTYYGDGQALNLGEISETSDIQVSKTTLTLSGVDREWTTQVYTEDYIDRSVKIYLGLFNSETAELILDPTLIFEGFIDEPVIQEDPDSNTLTVAVTATNHWVDFERTPGRRSNHEEQQLYFLGDMGFEFISEIKRDLKWGRA